MVKNAKKDRILKEDFTSHFSAALIYKALHYLQDLARALRVPLFTGAVTKEILESVMPLVRECLVRRREEELGLLRDILADGMRSGEFAPGDPDLMAGAAMAALTGLYDAFLLYGRESRIDEGLEQLFRLLMNGLRRRDA